MAKALYAITDCKDFEGIVWETKIGKIITMHGDINPQVGWVIKNCETGEDVVAEDMIDVLSEILPKKIKDVMSC